MKTEQYHYGVEHIFEPGTAVEQIPERFHELLTDAICAALPDPLAVFEQTVSETSIASLRNLLRSLMDSKQCAFVICEFTTIVMSNRCGFELIGKNGRRVFLHPGNCIDETGAIEDCDGHQRYRARGVRDT